MKKVILFLFLFLILISFISAQNISLGYPEKVELEKEFKITLSLTDFSQDNYDVKMDMISNGKRIAELLNNGEWRSTYYYFLGGINENEEKDFALKIVQEFETAQLTIRLRNSEGIIYTFEGYEIKFEQTIEEEKKKIPKEQEEQIEEIIGQENEESSSQENFNLIIQEPFSKKIGLENPETIILTSKAIEQETEQVLNENKDLKNKNNSKYYILAFCVLLAVLFLIKAKNKKVKTEFIE